MRRTLVLIVAATSLLCACSKEQEKKLEESNIESPPPVEAPPAEAPPAVAPDPAPAVAEPAPAVVEPATPAVEATPLTCDTTALSKLLDVRKSDDPAPFADIAAEERIAHLVRTHCTPSGDLATLTAPLDETEEEGWSEARRTAAKTLWPSCSAELDAALQSRTLDDNEALTDLWTRCKMDEAKDGIAEATFVDAPTFEAGVTAAIVYQQFAAASIPKSALAEVLRSSSLPRVIGIEAAMASQLLGAGDTAALFGSGESFGAAMDSVAMAGAGDAFGGGAGFGGMGGGGLGLGGGGGGAGGGSIGGLGRGGGGAHSGSEKRKAQAKVNSFSVHGALSQSDARKTVQRKVSAFRICYERELLSDSTLEGMVSVTLSTDASGKVASASASSSLGSSVDACIVRASKRLSFPKADASRVLFTLDLSSN